MEKAYIATIIFLVIGLAGCSSEGVTIQTTKTVVATATIGTTETTEPTKLPDEPTQVPEYNYDTSGNILSVKVYSLTAEGVTPSGNYTKTVYGYSSDG